MTPCQFKDSPFQVLNTRIETAHLKTVCVGWLPGVDSAGVDEDDATGRGMMFYAPMGEGLEALLNDADDVILMAVTWVGVVNVLGVQDVHVELRMDAEVRPFLNWHDGFGTGRYSDKWLCCVLFSFVLSHLRRNVLHDIALL